MQDTSSIVDATVGNAATRYRRSWWDRCPRHPTTGQATGRSPHGPRSAEERVCQSRQGLHECRLLQPRMRRSTSAGAGARFGRRGGCTVFVANSGFYTDELLDYCALATRESHQGHIQKYEHTLTRGVFRGGVPRDAEISQISRMLYRIALERHGRFRFFSSTPFGRPPLRPLSAGRQSVPQACVRETRSPNTRRATPNR